MIATLVLSIVIIVMPTSAYAYLDVGTGTLIVQGILAAVVGGFIAVKLYMQKTNDFIRRTFKREAEK